MELLVRIRVHVDVLDEVVVVEDELAEVQLLFLLDALRLLNIVHVFFIRVIVFFHAVVSVPTLNLFQAVAALFLVMGGIKLDAFNWSCVTVIRALITSGYSDKFDVFIWNHDLIRIYIFVLKIVILVILEMRISPT